jgi:F0F1-type ATP synthase beta subunit
LGQEAKNAVFSGAGERTREGNDLWLELAISTVEESTGEFRGDRRQPCRYEASSRAGKRIG